MLRLHVSVISIYFIVDGCIFCEHQKGNAVFRFHGKYGYVNAPLCYVRRTSVAYDVFNDGNRYSLLSGCLSYEVEPLAGSHPRCLSERICPVVTVRITARYTIYITDTRSFVHLNESFRMRRLHAVKQFTGI